MTVVDHETLLAAGITGHFGHRQHLQLGWHVVQATDNERSAVAWVREVVKTVAAAHGAKRKYNETMTVFWVRLLAHIAEKDPHLETMDELLAAHPYLLDSCLVYRHWSPSALFTDQARRRWVPPDLDPLEF